MYTYRDVHTVIILKDTTSTLTLTLSLTLALALSLNLTVTQMRIHYHLVEIHHIWDPDCTRPRHRGGEEPVCHEKMQLCMMLVGEEEQWE